MKSVPHHLFTIGQVIILATFFGIMSACSGNSDVLEESEFETEEASMESNDAGASAEPDPTESEMATRSTDVMDNFDIIKGQVELFSSLMVDGGMLNSEDISVQEGSAKGIAARTQGEASAALKDIISEQVCYAMAEKIEASFQIPREYAVVTDSTCSEKATDPACTVDVLCDGATMTLHLTGASGECRGPYGFNTYAGNFIVTYDVNLEASQLEINIVSDRYSVNNEPRALTAQAVVPFPVLPTDSQTGGLAKGGEASIPTSVQANVTSHDVPATGTVGTVVDGVYTFEVAPSSQCVTVDGTAVAVAEDDETTTITIKNFKSCGHTCPSGSITATETDKVSDDDTTVISFNGTHEATVQQGDSDFTVTLECSEQKNITASSNAYMLYKSWGCTGYNICMSIREYDANTALNQWTPRSSSAQNTTQCYGHVQDIPDGVAMTNCASQGEGNTTNIIEVTYSETTNYYSMMGAFYTAGNGVVYSYPLMCEPY